jgi:hypothetical protein
MAELKAQRYAGEPVRVALDTRDVHGGKHWDHIRKGVPTTASRSAAGYAVRIADLTIELSDDFREETFVRIVRALRSC